jgi:hypothetical protein
LVGGGVRYLGATSPHANSVLWRIANLLIYRMSPGVPNVSFYALVTLPTNPFRYSLLLLFNVLACELRLTVPGKVVRSLIVRCQFRCQLSSLSEPRSTVRDEQHAPAR